LNIKKYLMRLIMNTFAVGEEGELQKIYMTRTKGRRNNDN